jgi:hypothetical protein
VVVTIDKLGSRVRVLTIAALRGGEVLGPRPASITWATPVRCHYNSRYASPGLREYLDVSF